MTELRASLARLAGVNKDEAGAANALAGTTGLETVGALNVLAGTRGLGLNAVVRALTGGTGEAASELAKWDGGGTPPPVEEPVDPEAPPVPSKATLPLLLGVRQ